MSRSSFEICRAGRCLPRIGELAEVGTTANVVSAADDAPSKEVDAEPLVSDTQNARRQPLIQRLQRRHRHEGAKHFGQFEWLTAQQILPHVL